MDNQPRPFMLRDFVFIVRRHVLPISLILGFCLAAGFFVVLATEPAFRSSTTMLVEGRNPNTPVYNSNDPVSQITLPSQDLDIPTQIELLESTNLLLSTYDWAGRTPPAFQDFPSIAVQQLRGTRVLQVDVDARTPDEAAEIARMLPLYYLSYLRDSRQREVDNAITFLTTKQEQNHEQQATAQRKLEEFKRSRSLIPLEDEGTVRTQQLSGAELELVRAESTVHGATERLRSLVAALKALPEIIDVPGDQANTSQIQAQKNRIADLRASRESLLQSYLPDHPQVRALDAQIQAAEQYLTEIPMLADTSSSTKHPDHVWLDERIAEARSELQAAEAERARIQRWYLQAQQSLTHFNQLSSAQANLQREVEQTTNSITTVAQAIQELQVRRNSVRDPVAVLTPPSAPLQIRPRTAQYFALAAFAGLLIGIGFAFLRESLADRINSSEEAEQLAGLPALGEFPFVGKLPNVSSAVRSTAHESYDLLRYNIFHAPSEIPIRSILITSSSPNEGKSRLALDLALSSYPTQLRTILVDANIRSTALHLDISGAGFTDLLSGIAQLDDCLVKTDQEGLFVLPTGVSDIQPLDAFSSPRMSEVHASLLSRADLVIYDGPSCAEQADAAILATHVDAVIYLAALGITNRSAYLRGLEMLRRAGARILGIAIRG